MQLQRCAFNHPGCAMQREQAAQESKWYRLGDRPCCPSCAGVEADRAINSRQH